MKHARPDYDRIQDPAGLIPEDEPVFLIRGQDQFAIATLEAYCQMIEEAGGPLPTLVREQIERMKAWPVKKMPDGPHEQADERHPLHRDVKPMGKSILLEMSRASIEHECREEEWREWMRATEDAGLRSFLEYVGECCGWDPESIGA